jgi:hypothetical protein
VLPARSVNGKVTAPVGSSGDARDSVGTDGSAMAPRAATVGGAARAVNPPPPSPSPPRSRGTSARRGGRGQDAPYGDGSPDEQQATALYADVPLITDSFRLLASAGQPLAELPTHVVPFDPAALPPDPHQTARSMVCVPSAAVPREGAFACQAAGASGGLDPCFALAGDTLACPVNPATGAYTLVTATGPLPATTDTQATPVPFYVELGADKPPCAKRGQPVPVGGAAATYACQAPGSWLVGPLETARPVWIAQYLTSDTQNTAVTYGPEPTRITRAWVY